MSRRIGEATLAARVVGSLARIAVDRASEGFGRALPRTAEQLADPEVLGALLRESGSDLPRVRAASLPGIVFESSNCTNFLIDVEFEGGEGKRLYAKLASTHLPTSAFANAVGFWDLELHFCRHIAAEVSVRVPRVHAVARRGARFVLLLENLQELPGSRLFTNRDMAAGSTPERAQRCLGAFAELHAQFWNHTDAEREHLLPGHFHTFLAPGRSETMRAMNARAIEPAHDAAPDVFTKRHAALYRTAIEKWDALLAYTFGEPRTLVHGDSHLANCFEYDGEAGPAIGLLDFQGLHWGRGMRDVQYHLIYSLPAEVLAECESELIDAYLEALRSRGVVVAPDDAREQYRALSLQALSAAVVPLGLASLSERPQTLDTVLRRSVAAVDRLGLGDWLADL